MSDEQPSPNAGPEADAEATAVIRRARRSFGVSMAILIAGLMAVAFAVVYRLNRDEGPAIAEVALPADAELISAAAANGRLTLTYRLGGTTVIRTVDARTGAVLGEIAVVAE